MLIRRIVRKLRRIATSKRQDVLSRRLRFKDGTYFTKYDVVHYTERCGVKGFGAASQDEYEYWWQRACGIVSLRMIIDSMHPRENRTVFNIQQAINEGVHEGAYLTQNENGNRVDIGWTHSGLARIAARSGLHGKSMAANANTICNLINHDNLIIASVSAPFVRFLNEGKEPVRSAGHLVVIKGFEWVGGRCVAVYVEDPYDLGARKDPIDVSLFEKIYTGSIIAFNK